MSWLRLKIETSAEKVEPLAELLEQFEANSISYEPVSDEALFDSHEQTGQQFWSRTSVAALLPPEIDMDILLACVRNRIGTQNIQRHQVELLADREWTETYKSGFGKMIYADRLVIQPSWEEQSSSDLPVVILDPGLAFGSGTHTTTRLCLEWLATNQVAGKTVIDYGCGSGILALAAARLGAARVFAIDNDPQAIVASKSNAGRNGLQHKILVMEPFETQIPEADILVANILYKPLIDLAFEFQKLVKPGGLIVLSGILAGQALDCLDTYRQWFKMEAPVYRDEWSILYGRKQT